MQTPKFKVEFLEEASEFLDNIDEKVRDKIIYNITKARFSNDKELFKKLTDEIWELRTLFNKNPLQTFCFLGQIREDRHSCNINSRSDKENRQNSTR